MTVVTLLVAVPLGIVGGRLAWEAYARGLYIVPESVIPWLSLGLVAGVALVLANVLAVGAGGLSARHSPADALRAE